MLKLLCYKSQTFQQMSSWLFPTAHSTTSEIFKVKNLDSLPTVFRKTNLLFCLGKEGACIFGAYIILAVNLETCNYF